MTPPPEHGPSAEQLDLLATQSDVAVDYLNQAQLLAAQTDTAAALDSLVARMEENPDIAWAANVATGVNFEWSDGRPGAIVLRTLQHPPWGLEETRPRRAPPSPPRTSENVVPRSSKAIFLAPCYSEFRLWDESLREVADSALAHINYGTMEFLKDEEVTLARIRTLAGGGYGVIRISSHGQPWPALDDIQEVYFITGEVPTRESFAENWQFIENESLMICAYAGEKRYFVSSAYFSSYNDFAATQPLVSIGFCFGFLGHWPSDLRERAHVGAAVGWDWSVYTLNETPRAEDLFRALCDTSRTTPTTLQQWYLTANSYYWDPQDERNVTLFHNSAESFALWEPLKIESLTPSSGKAGDTVMIEGVGFGSVPGVLHFGSRTIDQPTSWSDTRIEFTVPSYVGEGTYTIYLEVEGRNSNREVFWILGDLIEKLHRTERIDFHFYGPHVYSDGSVSDRRFTHNLWPLQWTGTSTFTGHHETGPDFGMASVLDFSGSVGATGDTLNVEYTYTFTHDWEDGRHYVEVKRVVVEGLPLTRAYLYLGHQHVEYSFEGVDVRDYVTEIEYEATDRDPSGTVTSHIEWVRTDWERPDAEIEFILTFVE